MIPSRLLIFTKELQGNDIKKIVLMTHIKMKHLKWWGMRIVNKKAATLFPFGLGPLFSALSIAYWQVWGSVSLNCCISSTEKIDITTQIAT